MNLPRAPYQSPLRARLKEQTSIIILEAVATILRDADLSAVSIAEVARVAQVTEQTIYRHYNSRDELIRAFTRHHLERATGGPEIKLPETIAELLAWLEWRCLAWERDLRIVSEIYLSPVGRELRQPLFDLGHANILRMLKREHPHLDAETRNRIGAAILMMMSAENFVFLRRTLGYSPDHVFASIKVAIEAMLAGAK